MIWLGDLLYMDKRKHNELRKKRKAYYKRKKMHEKQGNSSGIKCMFMDYLVNCEDALSLMVPAEGRIYRLAHDPHIEIDIYPTSLWDYTTLTPKKVYIPETIAANSSLEDQQVQLRDFTPSFNITVEGVVSPFLRQLETMKSQQQLFKFKNKKGSHIFAYDVNYNDGLMWVEQDGHVAFLPYEGFLLEEHRADDFTPIPIDIYCKI